MMCSVIYSERRKGPRGGEFWLLTLDCGHLATKPIGKGVASTQVKCITCQEQRQRVALRDRWAHEGIADV